MTRNLEMSIAIIKRIKPAALEDLVGYLMQHHEKLFHEEVLLQLKKQDRELARLKPKLDPLPQHPRKKRTRSTVKSNGRQFPLGEHEHVEDGTPEEPPFSSDNIREFNIEESGNDGVNDGE